MINKFADRLLVICMLTNDCNQACRYCSENAGNGSIKMLTREIVENLMDDMRYISEESIISFIGGEATIWPEFFDMLRGENFQKMKLKTLYTNATAISTEDIELIKSAGFYEVRVSIDSDRKEEHDDLRGAGTFERAVEMVKQMVRQELPVTVGTVLRKSNIDRFDRTIDFFRELRVQIAHFFPLYMKGRGDSQKKHELDESDKTDIKRKLERDYPALSQPREPFCETGTAYFKVLNNGDCIVQKEREKILLGNLHDNRFKELYKKALIMLKPEMIRCEKCKYYTEPIMCENMHIYCMADADFRCELSSFV